MAPIQIDQIEGVLNTDLIHTCQIVRVLNMTRIINVKRVRSI